MCGDHLVEAVKLAFTLNNAMTTEKKLINPVAKITDFGNIAGLP